MKNYSGRLFYLRTGPFITFILVMIMNLYSSPVDGKDAIITDKSHYSNTFGEIRNYRVFLPPGYFENAQKRYPVIYFFHGWSQRYFGPVGDDYSNYDKGDDNNGDNIANYVATHDVIVVKPDGFNPLSDEEYNLTPYNECWVTTSRQFPLYFPEIVGLIDSNFRTIADREHRAVSGLSMGGFMSYWIGGKYPDMVSAAGNFCGSPEFMVGPLKIPVEYRILDMFRNYNGVNVRFHYGDRDNLRFFHQDMDRIWTEVMDNYELKIYNAAHSTCGLGDMFDFCLNTFINPPARPDKWDHTDVYPEFSVWGYNVSSDRFSPGFTIMEEVSIRGFRCSVREFLPDGEIMPYVSLTVTTPAVYEKNQDYIINDIEPLNSRTSQITIRSDNSGILKISLNGGLHNIGINKAGDLPNMGIASVSIQNMNWATNKKEVAISISLLNKGFAKADNVTATLSSTKSYVDIINNKSDFGNIDFNESGRCRKNFSFYVQKDSIEISKFKLTIQDGNNNEWTEYFELPLKKYQPEFKNFVIADGKSFTVAKAGISSETAFLGNGNGDGIANPGESIVILINDQDKYWRTNLYTNDEYVNPYGFNIRFTDFWDQFGGIGSSPKYSSPVISSACPEKHQIEFSAEYWTAENKRHIINHGTVKIAVEGKDGTPPKAGWVNITGNNTLQVKIYDGSAVKSVQARLILVNDVKGLDDVHLNEPESIIKFDLKDDGKEGDLEEADNVFTSRISETDTYFYRVEIEALDMSGNKSVEIKPQVFLVHAD